MNRLEPLRRRASIDPCTRTLPRELCSLLDDLTLGKLCLQVRARRGELPLDVIALRGEMVDTGARELAHNPARVSRAVDLVLGLGCELEVLARLGEVAADAMDGDQPGLVRIGARHLVRLRGWLPGQGSMDEHLDIWLARAERVTRSRLRPLRLLLDRQTAAVMGERAIGIGEAYQLRLGPSQLEACAEVAPARVAAVISLLRREPTMSSASIRLNGR